jgi:hypothetical protein
MWVVGSIINLLLFVSAIALDSGYDAYILPDSHPVKATLDAIFSESRVIFSQETLRKAGFDKVKPQEFTHLIVTKHPAIPGYVFKIYLDTQRFHSDIPEYDVWKARIQGANLIREQIAARNLSHLMKVPQKWIYVLPHHPKAPKDYYPKATLLIEDDMDILSRDDNFATWESDVVTEELLTALYHLLADLGLKDCAKPDNIPFSHDGRIAFVDTQTFGVKKVLFKKLTHYLSEPNKIIWKNLINQ